MKRKEALERLIKYAKINEAILITKYGYSALNDINIIKQGIERLESLEAKFDAYYELHKQLEKGYDELSVENDKLIQENRKLKKVIDILKRFVTISYCRNEETNKWDIPLMYSFGFSEKITQEEYDLLKGAFWKC